MALGVEVNVGGRGMNLRDPRCFNLTDIVKGVLVCWDQKTFCVLTFGWGSWTSGSD
jgi:hypothetical protein